MNLHVLTDGELLEAFALTGAEDAFDELVQRHGQMVFGACRRILGNRHDAEDAMQAVFAALAEKAPRLIMNGSLAGWLYSTAWHIASRSRRSQTVRNRHERQARRSEASASVVDGCDDDTYELCRAMEMLPHEYREAMVLHYLEGWTIEQVSILMGCSSGTTSARLSRAKAMMRERLSWRGVNVTMAAFELSILNMPIREKPPQVAKFAPCSEAPPAAMALNASYESVRYCGSAYGASTAAGGAAVSILSSKWPAAVVIGFLITSSALAVPAILTGRLPGFLRGRVTFRTSDSASAMASQRSAGMFDDPPLNPPQRTAFRSVPEPACMSLFAVGAVLLRRSRRRGRGRSISHQPK